MAKLGEGDSRWIVEERADGKNVGGWHWQEKDVFSWAQRRLRELLGGVDVVDSTSSFKTGDDVSASGEAIVNSRKGKLIPAYEMTIKGTWTSSDQLRGDWEVYLADENADEVPEVRATSRPGLGAAAEDAARAFAAAARREGDGGLASKLKLFVRELAAGGGGGGGEGGEEAAKTATTAASTPEKNKPAAVSATAPAAAPPKDNSSSSKTPTATLRLTEKFYCRPRDLVEALTDQRRVEAFTRAPAVVEGPPFVPGGKYSIFGGAVDATFAEGTDLSENRIALEWRFREWPDGARSRVVIELGEPSEGLTVATLVQSGIPTTDRFGNGGTVEVAESGWRDKVFGRIRQVFGYGVGL